MNPTLFLTVEFISFAFNLPMDGDVRVDRAPIKILEKEFGIPETARKYYVVKKVQSQERKVQMEWFLENVLLLIKSEYMSDKNYAYLYSAERGKVVSWAQIVHQKILSEIREKDKRKADKTSRLGPMLAAIFQRVKNLEMMFGVKFGGKIIPYVRNFKRQADSLDEGSPLAISKLAKVDMKKEAGSEFSSEKDVKGANKQKLFAGPLFSTPFAGGSNLSSVEASPSSMQKKGLRLKVSKAKLIQKEESDNAGMPEISEFRTTNLPHEVSLEEAKKAWKTMDDFLLQQSANTQITKRKQRELENKIEELEQKAISNSGRFSRVQELEDKIQSQQDEVVALKEKHVSEIQELHQKIKARADMEAMLQDWLTKIRLAFSGELEDLTMKNSKIVSSNEILIRQVTVLKQVQDQLRNMVDEEELEVDGVFMSTTDIEMMKSELMQTGNLIWDGIKERIDKVLTRPWEAFADKEHKEEVANLREEIMFLKSENVRLEAKSKISQGKQPQRGVLQENPQGHNSLTSLRNYEGLSGDSTQSFKFKSNLAGTSAAAVKNQEAEVNSFKLQRSKLDDVDKAMDLASKVAGAILLDEDQSPAYSRRCAGGCCYNYSCGEH